MDKEEPILLTEAGAGSRAVARYDAQAADELAHHVQRVPNDSSFVAQLIATADNLPQTRLRRRAEPRDALAAYALPQSSWTACGRTRRFA